MTEELTALEKLRMSQIKKSEANEAKKSKKAKGPVVPDRYVPDDPENIHLSKAQFIAKKQAKKTKELKLRAYEAELDAQVTKTEAPKAEPPKPEPAVTEPPKPRGRPKAK